MQVYRVCEMTNLADNRYMASLLPRATYYTLQKALRTDVTEQSDECNAAWAAAWEIMGALCGDEALLPHTRGGGGAWVSTNTLTANPTWRTANCTSSMTPRGTSLTFTSIWVTVDIYRAMALAVAT